MNFVSTRKTAPALVFGEAVVAGLAADGGLYVPEKFPLFDFKTFSSKLTLEQTAEKIILPFVEPDPLKIFLGDLCRDAFNFPIPVEKLDESNWMMELFHGPTAAFKDVGAQFLAGCISRIQKTANRGPRTVMVATSGDTGGAVASAFHGKSGVEVMILFPKGMVSPFQEIQLTAWGGNIHAFKVRGTFDDCQRIVKEAFLDPRLKEKNLISANSINIGRILPQSVYYAWASVQHFEKSKKLVNFIVPTGNLGNGLAAIWAKKIGFPIGKIILACNANKTIPQYFKTGVWQPQPTQNTLANAMDVGNPSNFERLQNMYPQLDDLKKTTEAFSVSDGEIKETVKEAYRRWKRIICPHTATGLYVRWKLPKDEDSIVVATAHGAKFQSVVEPLIGTTIPSPPSLQRFQKLTGQSTEIDATLSSLITSLP